LTEIYFKGSAPDLCRDPFDDGDLSIGGATNATVYYLPGTLGWDSTFGGRPTALWRPQVTGDDSFGIRTNQFGFNVVWASGMVIVVESCTNLVNGDWSPLQTNALSDDMFYFSDPNWVNYPNRYYRSPRTQ